MLTAIKIKVSGRVQGVGFRQNTVNWAKKLALRGWVKNRDDGAVEILALGPKEKIDQFLTVCRQGPPGAMIENFQIEWLATAEPATNFKIIYD